MSCQKPISLKALAIVFLCTCAIYGCENDQDRAAERLRNYTTQTGARGADDYAKLEQAGKVDRMCQQAIYVADVYGYEPREPETSHWQAIAKADCKRAGLPVPLNWDLAWRARPRLTKDSIAPGDAWPTTSFSALSAEYLISPTKFEERHRNESFKLSGKILSGVGESASPDVIIYEQGGRTYSAHFAYDVTTYALRPDDIIQFTCGSFKINGMSDCRVRVMTEADLKAGFH